MPGRPRKPKTKPKTTKKAKKESLSTVPEFRLKTGLTPERIAMARDELAVLEREARLTPAESDALRGHGTPEAKERAMEKMRKAAKKERR